MIMQSRRHVLPLVCELRMPRAHIRDISVRYAVVPPCIMSSRNNGVTAGVPANCEVQDRVTRRTKVVKNKRRRVQGESVIKFTYYVCVRGRILSTLPRMHRSYESIGIACDVTARPLQAVRSRSHGVKVRDHQQHPPSQ